MERGPSTPSRPARRFLFIAAHAIWADALYLPVECVRQARCLNPPIALRPRERRPDQVCAEQGENFDATHTSLLEHGLQQPGDVQARLGFYLGQLGLEDGR